MEAIAASTIFFGAYMDILVIINMKISCAIKWSYRSPPKYIDYLA